LNGGEADHRGCLVSVEIIGKREGKETVVRRGRA